MLYKFPSFLLFICLLCSSCSTFQIISPRKDFRIADRLVIQYEQQMEKEGFELHAVGGSYRKTIRELIFFYQTDKLSVKSVDQARDLIVMKVEQFLAPFNKNTYIRPYLHNFPFEAHNLTLVIGFVNKTHKYLLPPYIAEVKAVRGTVSYSRWNISTHDFEIIHTESYDRALSIYKSTKQHAFIKNK